MSKVFGNKDENGTAISTSLCPSDDIYFNANYLKSSLKRSSPSSKKKCAEKSVRFSSTRHVKRISHLNDMQQQTIEECWFTPEECDHIVQSYQSILLFMETNSVNHIYDKERETTRGLENMTRDGARKRCQRKERGWDSVMDEQERQWMQKEDDEWGPYNIWQLYQEANKESTKKALIRARQDEESIQEYLADTRLEESIRMIELRDNASSMSQSRRKAGYYQRQ